MLRRLFLGVWLIGGCATPRPAVEQPAAACLRLDERAGVPPSSRRACWDALARAGGPFADHAARRISALAGEIQDPMVSDAPARLRLAPAPLGRLPPPPPAPPPAPTSACLERARACDAACTGSTAWAECLGRCDTELGRCLPPR